ncbi:MAG: hypothetical protein IPP38_10050 [Bacteroidetes bacterium]|nr:hypothetical protein [Bacteroidota bacterium]
MKVGCINGDCQNGRGIYRTSAGNIYTGPFVNGKYQGKGKMNYRDGDVYEDDFANGKMHGHGVYQYKTPRL